jgi:hypothetical protein
VIFPGGNETGAQATRIVSRRSATSARAARSRSRGRFTCERPPLGPGTGRALGSGDPQCSKAGRATPDPATGGPPALARGSAAFPRRHPRRPPRSALPGRPRCRPSAGRVVALPTLVRDALRTHRLRQRTDRLLARSRSHDDPRDLVFRTSVGTPMDGIAVTRRFQGSFEMPDFPANASMTCAMPAPRSSWLRASRRGWSWRRSASARSA